MRVDKTPEGILDYMATGLAPHVTVFGVYPPSTKQELVPAQEVKRGSFEKGATILKLRNKQESVVTNLRVRRRDLRKAIKHMRESTAAFARKAAE